MHTHHAIDYIEFNVRDVTEAKTFFTAAFGWAFNDYGPDYAGIVAPSGDGEVGGLSKADTITTGGPLVILYSEDLEASAEVVAEAGGTITKPIFSFPGGRRFEFTDPSGNAMAVWGEAP